MRAAWILATAASIAWLCWRDGCLLDDMRGNGLLRGDLTFFWAATAFIALYALICAISLSKIRYPFSRRWVAIQASAFVVCQLLVEWIYFIERHV